jgi:hypothetical protein
MDTKWRMIVAAVVVTAGAGSVQAQFANTPFDPRTWNPGQLFPRRPPSSSYFGDPPVPVTVNATLENRTGAAIVYRINGGPVQTIEAGGRGTWTQRGTSDNPPVLSIEFPNGEGRVLRYRLKDGAVHGFQRTPAGLDLYRR